MTDQWTKKIHFSFGFFDDTMPESFRKRVDKVKTANPDHQVKIWGPKESRALMARRFPWALERYDSFPWAIQRSDMSRYAILFEEGGLYMDLDYKFKKPLVKIYEFLDQSRPGGQVFINETANGIGKNILSNSLMMAKQPGHPFWPYLIKRITKVKGAGHGLSRLTKIMSSTGPSQVSASYLGYKRKRLPSHETLQPLVKEHFNPCSICDRGTSCAKGPGVMAVHLNAGGWHSLAARVYNHLYCNRIFYYISIPIFIGLLVGLIILILHLKRCRKQGCVPCKVKSFPSSSFTKKTKTK